MNKLCESIDTLSMAYLDDELAAEELRDLELHLHECAACRAQVDAERDAIAELRRRLAPPPTPDVVRARLHAALDTEDAIVSRQERGERVASWMLPGAASLVAVAALAVFVLGRADRPPAVAAAPLPSIAEEVVKQQIRAPRIAPTAPRVTPPGARSSQFEAIGPTPDQPRQDYSIDKVASWETTLRDREVQTQLFQVTTRNGEQLALQASVFDAREWDLSGGTGDRMTVNGLDLRFGYADGTAMVLFQSANGLGYVFSSTDLTPDQLVTMVVEGELVTRVAPPR